MFVDNMAYSGSYRKNPFNFQHLNLQDVEVDISGNPIISRLTFDFEKNVFIRGYDTLFNSKKLREHENFINRNYYPNGSTIICFDLTPHNSDSNLNLNLKKN
jgi:hypothetical protein